MVLWSYGTNVFELCAQFPCNEHLVQEKHCFHLVCICLTINMPTRKVYFKVLQKAFKIQRQI